MAITNQKKNMQKGQLLKIILIVIAVGVFIPLSFFFCKEFLDTQAINHVVYSRDGQYFSQKKQIYNCFISGETGVKLKDGNIALYGLDRIKIPSRWAVDQTTNFKLKDLGLVTSKDGEKFQRHKITITNLDRDIRVADSEILALPDSTYRLYFIQYKTCELYSAVSENGYDFKFEGLVKQNPGNEIIYIADPKFFWEKKAQKYYLYSRYEEEPGYLIIRESDDGRVFSPPYKVESPFNVPFCILDKGNSYLAYGQPFYKPGVGGIPNDKNFDFRYPILAESEDAIHWRWSEKQVSGPWQGNDPIMGSIFAIQDEGSIIRVYF